MAKGEGGGVGMAAPVAEGAAASAAVALRAVLARAGRAEERSGAQRKQRGLWRWGRPSPSRCCGSSTTPDIAASARITCRRSSPRPPRFEFGRIVLQLCRSQPIRLLVCRNEMTDLLCCSFRKISGGISLGICRATK